MVKFLLKFLATAVALGVATVLVDGITLSDDSTAEKASTLIVVAVVFGVLNAVLKPIIKTIGCGLYILTLGLFGLVVNALLFLLVGWFAGEMGVGFSVDGFWAGFWGAIVVWLVSFVLSAIIDTVGED